MMCSKKYWNKALLILVVLLAGAASCGDDKKPRGGRGDDAPPAGDNDLPETAAADTCQDVSTRSLEAGLTYTGTTAGAANDYVAPCAPTTEGPDVVFPLVLDAAAGVDISVAGEEGFDSAVYLMQAPCDEQSHVASGCSDIAGSTERLQVASLAAGEYFVIVDSQQIAGVSGAGSFALEVTLYPEGLCVGDELDRQPRGDSVATAVYAGSASFDSSDEIGLRLCGEDVDVFAVGHMGGLLHAAVVPAENLNARLWHAVANVQGGEISFERGDSAAGFPVNQQLARGIYLVEISGSTVPDEGVDYSLSLSHACDPDFYDHPLVELDDDVPTRAALVFAEGENPSVQRRICLDERDVVLVTTPAPGATTVSFDEGIAGQVALVDPVTGFTTPISATQTTNAGVTTLSWDAPDASVYAVTLTREDDTVDVVNYTLSAQTPDPVPSWGCISPGDLADLGSPITGSTLGQPDRFDPQTPPLGPPSCTGSAVAGPDVVYSVTVPEGQILKLDLTAQFDAALYVMSSCPNAYECLGGTDEDFDADENLEHVEIVGSGHEVFVVIDSFDPLARGAFSLAWRIDPPAGPPVCGNGILERGEECDDGETPPRPGDGCDHSCEIELGFICPTAGNPCQPLSLLNGADSCEVATVEMTLPSAGNTTAFIADATAAEATNSLHATCGGLFGQELIYTFVADSDATYQITATGTDTILYAYAQTCGEESSQIACNDDEDTLSAGASRIEISTEAGVRYFVVLDFFAESPPLTQVTVERL